MSPDTEHLAPLAQEATALLKALGHPDRLMICCHLRDREMSVGEIETSLKIPQPRLSRELGKLRDEGLVSARKESKAVYYKLSPHSRAQAMVQAICTVMLEKPEALPTRFAPSLPTRPNSPGGYGVFARTAS